MKSFRSSALRTFVFSLIERIVKMSDISIAMVVSITMNVISNLNSIIISYTVIDGPVKYYFMHISFI